MLEPKDRLLLLESLRPPMGFQFDEGIGTTYTLDLLALLTAPLAFTWFEQSSEESGSEVDSLEVVESLRRHADRLTLFCHAGGIKVPKAHYPQLAFVEDAIVPCALRSGGAFHAKVWLLRFISTEGNDVRYRMLCLSRNLTFSRAWDTLLSLDGALTDRPVAITADLVAFVRALPDLAVHPASRRNRERAERLASEVERVRFQAPEGFSSFRFHAMGIGETRRDPLRALRGTSRLLIVSPFLTVGRLEGLAKGKESVTLVSRGGQRAWPTRRPSGLTACFTLKERLAAEPEEESVAAETADAIELSDLHAKLYVTESGSEAHVWTGSANATTAAFENNVEFMVELKGPRKRFGINALMEPEKGEVRFINLLEPADAAVASESPSPAVEELERLLEVRARISGARLKVRVTPASDGGFDLVLASSGEVNLQLGRGVAVTCWPCTLSSGAAVAVRTSTDQVLARFPSISLAAVTAFVAFRVSGQAGGEKLQIEFVLNLPLDGAPDGRKEQVLRSIVQDRSRMLKFLWLLLADELADLPRELVGGGSAAGQGAEVGTIPAIGGLFEMLLRTLDRAPERLDYLNGLMADIRKDATQPDLLPAGFDDIWLPIWRERERTRVPRS